MGIDCLPSCLEAGSHSPGSPPYLALAAMPGVGDLNSVFMLVWRALYSLSYLPGPFSGYFQSHNQFSQVSNSQQSSSLDLLSAEMVGIILASFLCDTKQNKTRNAS